MLRTFANPLRQLAMSAVASQRQLPLRAASGAANQLRLAKFSPFQTNTQSLRLYSAAASLSKIEVEGRIADLLKGFDKVTDETKITSTSHFANDLGLDSLDTVEVVMAIEEEFSIEIPDKEADKILSIDQAVSYILNQPDAH